MPEWGNPSWRDQGRTGPNGPQYASASDRRAVRRGGSPGDGKSCAVAALALTGGILVLITATGYGAIEAVKAVL